MGYKGAFTLPDGKPLVGEVMDRFRACGRFQDPILVGPSHVYEPLGLGCEVVNTQGALSRTLEEALRITSSRFGPRDPVAFTACDILPTPQELSTLMAHDYDPLARSVFWCQLVEAESRDMGASRWKPGYAFASPGGFSNLYPGHLVVIRPGALRFETMVRLLHLAYRYRNRPLWQRALGMTLQGIGSLALQDLRNLARFQLPVLALSIPYHCISGYVRYRRGHFGVPDLERVLARIFVHRDMQHEAGDRPVAFSVTRALSLAKDIDTQAELSEALGHDP